MAAEGRYGGGELELFTEAKRWKRYLLSVLEPHLRGDVLEVGAGIGGTTRFLSQARRVRGWTALEPDLELLTTLQQVIGELSRERSMPMQALGGTLTRLAPGTRFDTIVYIDVLEHIADDRAELERAFERLAPGGRVVVLAPAHAALYSEFDRQVGHHRRYDRRTLRALTPRDVQLVELRYLDSVGLLASLVNRVLLRASLPTPGQIRLWDGVMVPASRVVDVVSAGRLGKSILGVWEHSPSGSFPLGGVRKATG